MFQSPDVADPTTSPPCLAWEPPRDRSDETGTQIILTVGPMTTHSEDPEVTYYQISRNLRRYLRLPNQKTKMTTFETRLDYRPPQADIQGRNRAAVPNTQHPNSTEEGQNRRLEKILFAIRFDMVDSSASNCKSHVRYFTQVLLRILTPRFHVQTRMQQQLLGNVLESVEIHLGYSCYRWMQPKLESILDNSVSEELFRYVPSEGRSRTHVIVYPLSVQAGELFTMQLGMDSQLIKDPYPTERNVLQMLFLYYETFLDSQPLLQLLPMATEVGTGHHLNLHLMQEGPRDPDHLLPVWERGHDRSYGLVHFSLNVTAMDPEFSQGHEFTWFLDHRPRDVEERIRLVTNITRFYGDQDARNIRIQEFGETDSGVVYVKWSNKSYSGNLCDVSGLFEMYYKAFPTDQTSGQCMVSNLHETDIMSFVIGGKLLIDTGCVDTMEIQCTHPSNINLSYREHQQSKSSNSCNDSWFLLQASSLWNQFITPDENVTQEIAKNAGHENVTHEKAMNTGHENARREKEINAGERKNESLATVPETAIDQSSGSVLISTTANVKPQPSLSDDKVSKIHHSILDAGKRRTQDIITYTLLFLVAILSITLLVLMVHRIWFKLRNREDHILEKTSENTRKNHVAPETVPAGSWFDLFRGPSREEADKVSLLQDNILGNPVISPTRSEEPKKFRARVATESSCVITLDSQTESLLHTQSI